MIHGKCRYTAVVALEFAGDPRATLGADPLKRFEALYRAVNAIF